MIGSLALWKEALICVAIAACSVGGLAGVYVIVSKTLFFD